MRKVLVKILRSLLRLVIFREPSLTAAIDKLQQVQRKIDSGQTAAACNQLGAFINQVNAFLNNGSLTTSQGQALINAANAVKTSLGC